MRLRYSKPSPFARKVRVAASLLGLKLELEPADTLNPEDTLRRQNPLGKIPILLADDGEQWFDSRVILAYLDDLAGGGRILPTDPKARLQALRLEALADGLMDAGILRLYEGRFRPEDRHEPKWLDHQRGKMERALVVLEAHPPVLGPALTVGDIALACALGFLDFRFDGAWRRTSPNLTAWLDGFIARVPDFSESAPG
jgi:glutathione S-transferase